MKKYTIILVIATLNFELLSLNCFAQPNAGFENWTTQTGYETPDHWQTLNFLSVTLPPNPLSVSKATGIDKHSGNYALKLKTIYINNNPYPAVFDDTMSFCFTGKINFSPPSITYGFPYTGRPEKMEFWSKYLPVGADTGGARVILRKWNGIDHDTIAIAETVINQTLTYSLFQLDFTYYSTAMPDSAAILFGSSKRSRDARVGSTLYLDDVAFTGWVGIDDQKVTKTNKVKIYPNPVTDNLKIRTQIEEAENISIVDVSGKLIGVYKIKNHATDINVSDFPAGVYFYEMVDKKNKILSKDKFDVIK